VMTLAMHKAEHARTGQWPRRASAWPTPARMSSDSTASVGRRR
jgi:hypothetical protein